MKVAASIVACDFSNLKSELSKVNAADYIHFDVMDGHFVPNITIGPDILKAVKKCTKLPVNAHLMVSDPKNFVSAFSAADSITVHVEANDVDEAISKIKRQKQKIGLALNPETSVHDVQPYLKDIDFILVMTVNPG
ncbi:ribulose-phosphate 3-epimerase, partial [Candidatus Woesearchaeota archaeon]|nr:ribulose-phosphate 3-epimerase [Candidatus Woesearchaeota archaeon]